MRLSLELPTSSSSVFLSLAAGYQVPQSKTNYSSSIARCFSSIMLETPPIGATTDCTNTEGQNCRWKGRFAKSMFNSLNVHGFYSYVVITLQQVHVFIEEEFLRSSAIFHASMPKVDYRDGWGSPGRSIFLK